MGPHKQAGEDGGGGGGVFCAPQWHTPWQPQFFDGPVASQLQVGPHPHLKFATGATGATGSIGGATDVSIGLIGTAGFVCGRLPPYGAAALKPTLKEFYFDLVRTKSTK